MSLQAQVDAILAEHGTDDALVIDFLDAAAARLTIMALRNEALSADALHYTADAAALRVHADRLERKLCALARPWRPAS